jgi:L-methionine (R)-S-oxide reductase
VDEFPGHIACSSEAKSEIVLPAYKNGEVVLVLDVDSSVLNDFDDTDRDHLQQVIAIVERFI